MNTICLAFTGIACLLAAGFCSNQSMAQSTTLQNSTPADNKDVSSDEATTQTGKEGGPEGDWIQLFNGKDLKGWKPKFTGHPLNENYKKTFRVEDGLLKVSYDNWDEFNDVFGHLFYKDTFSRYRLRVEYRFVGEQVKGGAGWAIRNNGLMIHGQSPQTITLDQKFPNSIEVQLLGGNGKKPRSNLNVCTPGTQIVLNSKLNKKHCIKSNGPTFAGEDWVTVEVEVRGSDSVKHIVDGKVVLEYTNPQLDDGTLLTEGAISIQAESAPTEFRKIELMVLED